MSSVRDGPDEKPPAKRRKKCNRVIKADASAPTIPCDALILIMSFLHPRELYNFAFTCKALQQSVTTKMVVQSAMCYGGNPKKNMEILGSLMEDKSIYPPTTLRLLRIVNGKRCELCNEKKVMCVKKFGIFSCKECSSDMSSRRPRMPVYSSILGHPRVAVDFTSRSSVHLMRQARTDASGDRIGAIVTSEEIDLIVEDDGDVDHHLETRALGSPSTQEYEDFVETFVPLQDVEDKMEKDRLQKLLKKKLMLKEKADWMLNQLSERIDPRVIQAGALKYGKSNCCFCLYSECACIRMQITFVDDLLKDHLRQTKKASKKVLEKIAEEIEDKMTLVLDTDFLSLNWLSDSDPFESALKEHLREYNKEYLSSSFERERSPYFFECLRKNEMLEALNCIVCFGHLLVPRNLPHVNSYNLDDHVRDLAETIWNMHMGNTSKTDDSTNGSTTESIHGSTDESKYERRFHRAYDLSMSDMTRAMDALVKFDENYNISGGFTDVFCHKENVELLIERKFHTLVKKRWVEWLRNLSSC